MDKNKNITFSYLLSHYRVELMGVAMISIILYHQPFIQDNFIATWCNILGYIGVEVFLIVSGFGIAHSLNKNNLRTYFYNRFIRLFPACFIAGLMKIITSSLPPPIEMPKASSCFIWDLIGISNWYIYAIVVYYCLAPVLFKLIKKYGWFVLIVTSIISYIVVAIWKNDVNAHFLIYFGRWIVKRLPVFVLGLTIALKPLNVKVTGYVIVGIVATLLNLISLRYIIIANANPGITSMPAGLFTHLPNRTDIPDNGRYLLDMFSVMFLCPMFVVISKIMDKLKIKYIISWLGIYSLEVYLCHQYIFAIFNKYDSISPWCQLFYSIGLTILATLFIRRLSNVLVSRIRYYFV